MIRRRFAVATLVLLAATALVWLRSYSVCDEIALVHFAPVARVPSVDRVAEILIGEGRIGFSYTKHLPGTTARDWDLGDQSAGWHPKWAVDAVPSLTPAWVGWLSFDYHEPWTGLTGHMYQLALPLWLFCVLIPAPYCFRIFRRSCRPKGETPRCLVCGYDLRASNDRCPECGTLVCVRINA